MFIYVEVQKFSISCKTSQRYHMKFCWNIIVFLNLCVYIRPPQVIHNGWNFLSKQTSHFKAADSYDSYDSIFDFQYWKCNNICNTWKKIRKLKILSYFPKNFLDTPKKTIPTLIAQNPKKWKFSDHPQQIFYQNF